MPTLHASVLLFGERRRRATQTLERACVFAVHSELMLCFSDITQFSLSVNADTWLQRRPRKGAGGIFWKQSGHIKHDIPAVETVSQNFT